MLYRTLAEWSIGTSRTERKVKYFLFLILYELSNMLIQLNQYECTGIVLYLFQSVMLMGRARRESINS